MSGKITALLATLTLLPTAAAADDAASSRRYHPVAASTAADALAHRVAATEASLTHGGGQKSTQKCSKGCDCCYCPVWTIRAEAVFLQRSRADNRPLLRDTETGPILLDVDDLDSDFDPGWRLTAIRDLDACTALEISFLAIDSWNSSGSAEGDDIFITVPGTQVPGNGTATFDYSTSFYSTEINLRRRMGSYWSWLVGFRWIELHDELTADYNVDGFGPDTLSIDTDNHMYGAQVGLERSGYWGAARIDLWAKAGIFANNADQSTSVASGVSVSAEDTSTAYLGELGIAVSVPVSRRLSIRGGYQVIWLENVALAPNQYATTDLTLVPPIASVHDTGDLTIDGFFLGLEGTW